MLFLNRFHFPLHLLLLAMPLVSHAANDPPADAVESDDAYQAMETLTKAMELIRQNYVDEKKVGYERLVASALRGILEDLDPHSQYMSPEVFEQLKESQDDTTEGIGVTVSPKGERMVVVSVREDGPAARSGVMPGDAVVRVGESVVEKLSYGEVVRLLRGNPGEPLKLTVYRSSTKETKEVNLVREVLRQDSVRDAMVLPAALTGEMKIGYVRLLQFNAPSAKELTDALDGLEEKGIQGLVLDLRNNPGGLLRSAVDICGEFLPPDTTVVTTETRYPEHNPPPFKTKARTRPPRSYPLVLLVNHGSASASELVAGALQDLKRALIVGETTFGKGSVQTVLPGERGTAIRMTTAKYYTPSHRTIHEKGVTPDIISTLTTDEEKSIFEWRRNHPLASGEPAQIAKLGDKQLERAIASMKGLLVKK
jgi:carboxyl-terminal processing protease